MNRPRALKNALGFGYYLGSPQRPLLPTPMPFIERTTLTTPRLILRPPRLDDAEALFAIWSDEEAMRYFSFPAMTRFDQATERVERLVKSSVEGKDFVCVVELQASGEVLGNCDLFRVDEQCRRAEIGFSLKRRHWGSGFMSEAATAVIGHAFGTLNLRRLEADIDPRNTASAHLLERLGFVREGLLRERWIVGDEVSDSALYGLLEGDRRS
ncbi:Spermidine N(1)-acetyltransferase [Burkholderia sp. AD24]|jgi:[ribosomal protein S5]-alanine N-acetyltransferase|nr:Spermidine N(1)-acetyltransferase [Burkholderia sp. AD24]